MDRSTTDDGSDELDGIDLPNSAAEYGVDERGATHYHSAVRHEIYVVQDGEIVQHYDDVATIDDWHEYVAARRGWEETYYSEHGFAELLIEDLREMGVVA